MADVTVEASPRSIVQRYTNRAGPCWVDEDTGYVVVPGSGGIDVYKTTDGGATWAAADTIVTDAPNWLDIWFDKWTTGDSGAIIHIAYANTVTDDIEYIQYDTSDDTEGSIVTVFAGTSTDTLGWDNGCISVVKARGGNIYVGGWIDNDGESPGNFYRSTNGGTSFGSRAAVGDGDPVDSIIFLPGGEADNQDIQCIYWDKSANEISLKTYDNSGDSWSENSISTGMTDHNTSLQMSAAQRHSDDHIILAAWNALDASTADLKIWDITDGSTITAKTDAWTNQDGSRQCAIFINQQNDDLYIAACVSAFANLAFSRVMWNKSTNGGTSWGTAAAYDEIGGLGQTLDGVWSGNGVGNEGGRFSVVWYNVDDTNLEYNKVNSVEITAPTPVVVTPPLATLSLTGQVPTADVLYTFTPNATALTLTAPAVTISNVDTYKIRILEGFEVGRNGTDDYLTYGSGDAWGTNIDISGIKARTGLKSLRINMPSGAGGEKVGILLVAAPTDRASSIPGANRTACSFYINAATLPSGVSGFVSFSQTLSTSLGCYLTLESDGTLKLYDSTNTLAATATAKLDDASQWYRLDVIINGTSNAAVEVWIEGTKDIDESSVTGAVEAGGIFFGRVDSTELAYDIYIDDLWYDVEAVPDFEYGIALSVPDEDGNARVPGEEGNSWNTIEPDIFGGERWPTLVDWYDDSTTYVQADTAGKIRGYFFEDANDMSIADIRALVLWGRGDASAGSGDKRLGLCVLNDDDPPETIFEAAPDFGQGGWQTAGITLPREPSFGANVPSGRPWTDALFAADQFGFDTWTVTGRGTALAIQVAYLFVADTFTPPSGTLTLTGLVPSALTPQTFTVPLATLTLTGQAPAPSIGEIITVPLATLTLSGLVPDVQTPVVETPPLATLSLTGQVPLIDLAVIPPLATLTLTGQTPSTLTPEFVPIPLATLTLSGAVPDVGPVVTTPVAALTLTGFNPALSLEVIPPVASLTLAGLAPVHGTQINVPLAALTLSGFDPLINIPSGINVPSATLTLAGQVPIAAAPRKVTVPVATLTLSGQVPSTDTGINVPVATLTLAGFVADIQTPVAVTPPLATLTLTGQVPTATASSVVNVEVPPAALTLAGQAPTITATTFQFLAPDGTVSSGSWTPTGAATLHEAIDEKPASDADYDQSGNNPATDTMEVSLVNPSEAPSGTDDHVVRWRNDKSANGGRTISLVVSLRQGASTEIASWTIAALPNDPALEERTLTGGEAGSITNYNDLRLRFVANDETGSGAARAGIVTWAELQVPGAGAVSVEIPLGTLSLTGQVPALDLGIVPPIASLSLSGQVPTAAISDNQSVTVPVGALSLAGQVPAIATTEHVSITPPAAALTLAALISEIVIPFPVATLSLTGFVPVISTPNPQEVEPPVGSLSLTGQAPVLDLGIIPPVGTLTLSGQVPTVSLSDHQNIEVPAASLSLTGQVPEVNIGVIVPVASLSLTGQVLTVSATQDVLITPPVTALSLSAFAPPIISGEIITVPLASLSLAGQAPLITTSGNQSVDVPVSTLTLSGQVPDIVLGDPQLVTVPVATLSLSGLVPVIDLGVIPPVASLTLAGQVLTLDLGITPPVSSLSLTGQAPVLGLAVSPPLAALSLSGQVPSVTASAHASVEVPVASLSLSAFAPTLGGEIDVPTASLSVSGFAPVVSAPNPQTVVPPTAALSLNGLAPTLQLAVSPPTASLSLSGFVPTITPIVPVASLTLSGLAPIVGFTGNQSATPPTGALSLSGLVPVVDVTVGIPIGTGIFTGFAPTVVFGEWVTPPVASLTVTGQAPTIQAPRLITPPLATLTITGLTPNVLEGGGSIIPVATLTVAGFAPAISVAATLSLTKTPIIVIGQTATPRVIGQVVVVTITGEFDMAVRTDMIDEFTRGENVPVQLVLNPATDITGWTFEMVIKVDPGDAGGELIEITSPTVDDATKGKATFTLTKTHTESLTAGTEYDYDIWRTNADNEKRLSYGRLRLLDRVAEF
jgi:hypothetical protein